MFTSELCLKIVGEQTYIVIEPLSYETEGFSLCVNRGFDFDGASVPQIFWSFGLSPMTGSYQRSACLHDALYACEFGNDRGLCDDLFLEAMESDGVGFLRRMLMYGAVRAFGWVVWNKHTKEDVNAYQKFITYSLK